MPCSRASRTRTVIRARLGDLRRSAARALGSVLQLCAASTRRRGKITKLLGEAALGRPARVSSCMNRSWAALWPWPGRQACGRDGAPARTCTPCLSHPTLAHRPAPGCPRAGTLPQHALPGTPHACSASGAAPLRQMPGRWGLHLLLQGLACRALRNPLITPARRPLDAPVYRVDAERRRSSAQGITTPCFVRTGLVPESARAMTRTGCSVC